MKLSYLCENSRMENYFCANLAKAYYSGNFATNAVFVELKQTTENPLKTVKPIRVLNCCQFLIVEL